MRSWYCTIYIVVITTMVSCGGKPGSKEPNIPEADSAAIKAKAVDSLLIKEGPDTTVASVFPALSAPLKKWFQSFGKLDAGSFHQNNKWEFEQIDYEDPNDLTSFYELYKPAMSFSPDSSQFIDLYSYGLMLEKKGKKIIASGEVDQSVTLCNLKTKEWKRIAFFGPSANMEEAVWVSPTKFVLAGTMQDEKGEFMPVLLMGNTASRILRWFEATSPRKKSLEYTPSGMTKLKIDEWE